MTPPSQPIPPSAALAQPSEAAMAAATPRTDRLRDTLLDAFKRYYRGEAYLTDFQAYLFMVFKDASHIERELAHLTASLAAAQADQVSANAAYNEMRDFHDASVKELYRMLGVDGSDGEFRFKWAALELANKLSELSTLRTSVAVAERERDEAKRIADNAVKRAELAENDERLEACMKVGGALIAMSSEFPEAAKLDTGIEVAQKGVLSTLRADRAAKGEDSAILGWLENAHRILWAAENNGELSWSLGHGSYPTIRKAVLSDPGFAARTPGTEEGD